VAGKLLKSGIRVKNRLKAGTQPKIFSITSCPTCGFLFLPFQKKEFPPLYCLCDKPVKKIIGFPCFVFKKLSYIVFEINSQGT
jgi:hypothetical protein